MEVREYAAMARPGRVYVLFNPRMPGLVKIGKTTRTAEERASSLRTTGVPAHFLVLYDIYVADMDAVERAVHEALASYRVERDREFFSCSPKEAINTLLQCGYEPTTTPPETLHSEVEIRDELLSRFGPIFHTDLSRVTLCVSDGDVILRTTRRSAHNESITIETNLDVIGLENGPLCDPGETARENASRLLSVDELTLVMCTPLVREEEAHRIDREQNPYWTGLWLALDDD